MNKDKVLEALENYRLNTSEEQKKKDLEYLETNCMTKIKDIEKYNSEMAKSIEDKLWFTQFLEQSQFYDAIIVDYGCGDGTLIRKLEEKFWSVFDYFGIDNNEEMLKIASSKISLGDRIYYSKNIPQLVTNRPKILILSSVLHEILSYSSLRSLEEIRDFQPDYIFIRDMYIDESAYRNVTEDISKVREHPLYKDFIKVNFGDENGLEWADIIHFLFKYRYEENWEREVQENYLSFNFHKEDFDFWFTDYYTIYEKQYTLPFLKEQVKKDFGIDLIDNTHINLILKRR